MQWQKIETAPIEDVVLVYIPHSAGGYVTGGILLNSGDWVNNTDNEFIKPSHWMPLPEPPSIFSDVDPFEMDLLTKV